jgi:hypothetical protein
MFEFVGIPQEDAVRVNRLVSAKLPMRIKLVIREEQEAF